MVSERTISLDCARCGDPITLAPTGRRPRYCSDTCRKRASEERRAAARLGYPQPVTRVVREVVERVITPVAPPPRTAAPPSTVPRSTPRAAQRSGQEWAAELRDLANRMRTRPLSLVRSPDEFEELAAAVAELHAAFQPGPPSPTATAPTPIPARVAPPSTGTGLSRQQRRAMERQQRKRTR